MGARGSKTKPNADAPPSRQGSKTLIVTMDSAKDIEDEVRAPETIATRHWDEHDNTSKVSKVQEILEGKVELRKNHQPLEQLPKLAHHIAAMDLQFSSSEDSDDTVERKRRKGAKKKRSKSKGSSSTGETVTTTKPFAPVSSPKVKLNEVKTLKKFPPSTQPVASVPVKEEYFDQISAAYSLTEYAVKDPEDGKAKRQAQPPHWTQARAPLQLQRSARLQQPQHQHQLSPSTSPSKYFGGAFDNWRRPSGSARSNRSLIMETRDVSRKSPPNHSNNPSAKSNSSRAGDRYGSTKPSLTNQPANDFVQIDHWQSDIDELERESSSLVDSCTSLIETNAALVAITTTITASTPTPRPKSNRRSLRIDEMDESIMDTILAEVVP